MGIVTGIGDKNLNKNVIVPKIDADINDYILNKNCIINGLEVIGNTLTAGMCVLKGYRGMLENDETLNGETYIYGKFTLNFDNEIPDNFEILKTNTVPQDGTINSASITEQGIYYLLLYTYTNGAYVLNSELNTPTYPAHAYEADETDLVKSGAVIESGVIATTQNVNCHDDLDTDNVINKYVATTEYVHNQIEEEIDYDKIENIQITTTYSGSVGAIGYATISKKAKYVKVIGVGRAQYNTVNSDCNITIPEGYRPKENGAVLVFPARGNVSTGTIYHVYLTILEINTNGTVTATNRVDKFSGTQQQAEEYIANLQYISGWETN